MRDSTEWSRLDNAAKIFPPNSSKRDTKVFRFACELVEDVDAQMLQHALEKTVQRFPLYRSTLKQGLFWYYFEQSTLAPQVEEESGPPCAPLYDTDHHGLLFRVTYYKKRINLEVFHALADGTGALQFLRTLVLFYLSEKHGQSMDNAVQLADYTASHDQKRLDAFYKYYEKEQKIPPKKKQRAYHIWGTRLPDNQMGIIEGVLSAKAVLAKAHQLDATLSEFLIALFICSIYDCMAVRDRARPVVISVPVDLRRFFPTQTARNFFGVIHVGHNFKTNGEAFGDVLENVRRSFRQQLVPENMLGIINRYSSIENRLLIKTIPLQIKILCLKLAGWWAQKEETSSFSNIGRITMPEELAHHIRLFDVLLSARRPQVCLCSYGDMLTISFSSPFVNTDIQQCFFRRLAQMGMEIEIVSNLEKSRVRVKEDEDAAL